MLKRFLASAAFAVMLGIQSISLLAEDLVIDFKSKQSGSFGSVSYTVTAYYSSQYHLRKYHNSREDDLTDYVNSVKYHINHGEKTIKKYTLEDAIKYDEVLAKAKLDMPEKFEINLDEEMKHFISMEENIDELMRKLIDENNEPTVKKTGAEKVLKRKCDKWKASLGNIISLEVSLDPTLIPPEPQNIEVDRVLTNALSKVTMRLSEKARNPDGGTTLKRQAKVLIWSKVLKLEEEATRVVQGPIPASVFELPKGYTMEDEGKKKLEKLIETLAGMTR
ncbi:MAG: hypothetical protein LBB40_02785 [Holophagales bacterium]|jgi:hypothetical protein|nr:hypothetical protein [Holophagales bacterium]